MIDDLQEYKENLEAEIRRLEKRIGTLRTTSAKG
jgi:chaperonin cofactor prefoldin